jgi:hypothetical protein
MLIRRHRLMPGPAYPGQSTPVLAEIYSEAFTVL